MVTERDAPLRAARARVGALLPVAGGVAASNAMSDELDGLVRGVLPAMVPSGIAVVATGGWGRRETAPWSDIDVLFLSAGAPDEEAKAFADRVLYPLWDAGVEVGHQVRSVAEATALAHDDLATLSALLDARLLAGDPAPLAELRQGLGRGDTNLFVRRLIEAKAARHDRFGDTLYLLEPNLKHGQGGLRDLATGLWAAKIRWKVKDFSDLLALGQASARQVAFLSEARDFLLLLRAHLHLGARRRLDQLTFEMQEAIAPTLHPDARGIAPAVEALMRRYYLHAKSLVREVDRLLERALVPPQRPPHVVKLDATFTAFNGRLSVVGAEVFRDTPAQMVRLFQVALERGLPVYGHTKELVAERVATDGTGVLNQPGPRVFLELLTDPRDRGTPSILEEMHELGLLNALMPEFAPCTGRVQHDLYHVYTVDQHQLYAVAQMKRIARGELGKELAAIHAEVTAPAPLYLGTLLHDVGKPLGKGHSEKGARLATSIARRLGMDAAAVARIEFLVRHHLLMSHLSQRRDLDDAGMIAKFARVVKDEDTLRDLYLLTVCDTAMTAPGNMTEWKAHLLRELYGRTRAFLRRGPDLLGAERSALVKSRRRRVASLLGEDEQALAGLPDRYLASLPPRTIAQQVRLWRRADPIGISVTARPRKGHSELLIVAPDVPGLLMNIAGVLTANRIDILGANIHSRAPLGAGESGTALDVFIVRDRKGEAISEDDPRWQAVDEDLRRALSGAEDISALVERRREKSALPPRVTPAVRTEIEADNDVSDDYTVLDVYAQDRLGVLYAITRTLTAEGLDIGLSKVATEADRACDIFYVRDQGRKLTPDKLREVEGKLRDALR